MKYFQDQESFSFSTSSKTSLFSDDKNCGVDDHNHTKSRISSHQQSGYFEISLPPPSPLINKTNHEDTKEEEFEFCLSFNSSSTRLIEFPITPLSISRRRDLPQVGNVVDKKHNHHNKSNNTISYKRVYQRVSSPRCHQGLVSPYVFRDPSESQRVTQLRAFGKHQRELTRNRKSSKLVGLRKFMVKLRSIKKMLRSSLNTSRRLKSSQVDKVTKKTNTAFMDHKLRDFSHMPTKSDKNSNNIVLDVRGQKGIHDEDKSSRMMNFNGFSKMLDVVMKNIGITRRSKQMGSSKSCPVSIKSSPLHDPDGNERRISFYSRDHSIQAAIAHCKRSFGK